VQQQQKQPQQYKQEQEQEEQEHELEQEQEQQAILAKYPGQKIPSLFKIHIRDRCANELG
jgi:hypothetical protein